MTFEAFMTKRYLKVRHSRRYVALITMLAAVGVALGVMVLVVVIAVMSGFQAELKKQILGIEAHLLVMRYNNWIEDYPRVVKEIESIEGVESAMAFVAGQGMLRTAAGVSGVALRGVAPRTHTVEVNTQSGRELGQVLADNAASSEIPVVLGTVLADKLKLSVGDGAMLMVVTGRQAEANRLPRMYRMKVIELFDTGMHQYDGVMGFVDIHRLQSMVGVGDLATGIEVRLDNPDNVESVGEKILEAIGFRFWVNDWKQMHRNLFAMLLNQKFLMYIILTLIIVVAAFNVSSALIMMVREKTKDIAILKAMGATQASVRKIFLRKGLVIGSVGIGLGTAAGLLVCALLARYPVSYTHLTLPTIYSV